MKPIIPKSILLMLVSILSFSGLHAKADLPNIVLIFADDLGPGLLGCNGQEIIKTPNIDQIANEGMSFNNYYGGVYCAPSRWCLATGMHDGRKGGWAHTGAGLAIDRDAGKISEEEYQTRLAKMKANANPIPDHEVFLGQIAQKAGYKTAQFGKLDRGFTTWHERVKRFGWDFYEGMYDHVRCHGFYPPYIWRNGEKIELEGNPYADCGKETEPATQPVRDLGKTYSQNVFIESLLNFMRDNKEEPFFIYHPTQLPHGPVAIPEIHPDFVNDERLSVDEKIYASMVKMLDDHVGLILDELEVLGLADNTIVIFSSDNGHELYYGPKPSYQKQFLPDGEKANITDRKWRGRECGDIFDGAGDRAGLKRSGFQGGMQCPLLVRWPGKVEGGSTSMLLSSHYDFLATVADIGGVETPSGKDSLSYLPTLLGEKQKEHDFIFVRNNFKRMGSHALLTKEGWKLVKSHKGDEYQLYNYLEDNAERHELNEQHPEIVEKLKMIMARELNSERPDL